MAVLPTPINEQRLLKNFGGVFAHFGQSRSDARYRAGVDDAPYADPVDAVLSFLIM